MFRSARGLALAIFWFDWDWLTSPGTAAGPDPVKGIAILLMLLAGAIYFPMALLAVAMFDSLAAVNPLLVIPAMRKAPMEYLVVVFVSSGIMVVLLVKKFLTPFIPIPLLPSLVSSGLSFYLFMVQVRLLGILYHARRRELGWFTRT